MKYSFDIGWIWTQNVMSDEMRFTYRFLHEIHSQVTIEITVQPGLNLESHTKKRSA